MTFARPPRPVPNDMVKMTDRGLRLRQAGVTYSGLVKSINNSILVVLGLILLVAVHGGESLRPFGVNINVRDVRYGNTGCGVYKGGIQIKKDF